MSYWADEVELSQRAASYVDRVLKGASPDGLPIEQPTKYDLLVNLKTAKALALTLPPSLLLRATVIELSTTVMVRCVVLSNNTLDVMTSGLGGLE
jgi:putative ABC transport system substrate-binding protein